MAAARIFKMHSWALIWSITVMLLPHIAHSAPTKQVPSIHILASESMVGVLSELVQQFSATHHMTASVTFNAPDILLDNIERGEQANLIITEDAQLMKELKQRGLIDVQSISILATDSLVLATSPNHHIAASTTNNNARSILKTLNEKSLFILANPTIATLGKVGKSALEQFGLWQTLTPYMAQPPTLQQTRYQIENGAGVGLLYASTTHNQPSLTTLATIPKESHPTIAYQTAVVASPSMEGGRALLEFLKEKQTKKRLAEHGFEVTGE